MSEKPFVFEPINNMQEATALIGRLFDAALPEAVFSDPVSHGEYTVITAKEIAIGMGAGFGSGGGTEGDAAAAAREGEQPAMGYGNGGGGGGSAIARPVAAISIGPDGVRIEPIVDPTKIAIAFFTTIVSMIMIVGKVRRQGRGRK